MTSLAVMKLRRGETYEPECDRTSRRLGTAMSILESLGVKHETEHDPSCRRYSGKWYAPDCTGRDPYGYKSCMTVSWPEWVTDEMFQLAYSLASEVATEEGKYNRRQASRSRRVTVR